MNKASPKGLFTCIGVFDTKHISEKDHSGHKVELLWFPGFGFSSAILIEY